MLCSIPLGTISVLPLERCQSACGYRFSPGAHSAPSIIEDACFLLVLMIFPGSPPRAPFMSLSCTDAQSMYRNAFAPLPCAAVSVPSRSAWRFLSGDLFHTRQDVRGNPQKLHLARHSSVVNSTEAGVWSAHGHREIKQQR